MPMNMPEGNPTNDAAAPARPRPRRRFGRPLLLAGSVLLLLAGGLLFADWWTCLPEGTHATYVGRQSCIRCHEQEGRQWAGSDHDRAMDVAREDTVLGDFNNAELTHYGITSRMYRRDGKFMVHTEGPDGKMADFEVKYVFGVRPLQQYLVEFDRPADMPPDQIARLQVLRISWDTERKRWFYLSPPDVDESVERLSPEDDLHWTGIAQRWNNMCADCHSTNVRKGYDVKTHTYHTTFSEIDVSCEACHGPGSIHVQLAESKSLFWDRKLGYGLARLKSSDPEVEIEACAPCHSRRRVVYPGFQPGDNYFDHYHNELLFRTTYFPDGQIMDEDYVFGSFIQSKMYHRGIRCTDCHNPHTARLRYEGNRVCTSCHQHPASKYDTPAHHHHKDGSTGALCVECHMPETTYMDVDPRRDHSIRIPRPDLSIDLGTPNACTRCHLADSKLPPEKRQGLRQYNDWILAAREGDEEIRAELARLDRWAKQYVDQWYQGQKPVDEPRHFAYALARAHDDPREAERELLEVVHQRQWPAIVRATALTEMAPLESRATLVAALTALSDPSPLVRAAALPRIDTQISLITSRAAQLSPEQAVQLLEPIVVRLFPLVRDPVRLVRTEAARVLANLPAGVLAQLTTGPERQLFETALEEFKTGVLVSNDRAAAHMTLGILYEALGQLDAARAAYQTAIGVEPGATGPRSNLAALLDRMAEAAARRAQTATLQRNKSEQEQALDEAARLAAEAARLRREELDLLARDAHLAPEVPAVQYRYGLSLYLHGEPDQAEQHLRKAYELEPHVPDYVLALALLYQKQQRWQDALEFAERLVELRPDDPTFTALLEQIRRQATSSQGPPNP